MFSVLPLAFFELHVITSLPIRAGDKPVSKGTSQDFEDASSTMLPILDSLKPQHICQLLQGREWLRVVVTRLVTTKVPQRIHYARLQPCLSPGLSGCKDEIKKWWDTLLRDHTGYHQLPANPISAFITISERFNRESAERYGVCSGCKGHICEILGACRQYMWDELPYFFAIKPREEGAIYGCDQYL